MSKSQNKRKSRNTKLQSNRLDFFNLKRKKLIEQCPKKKLEHKKNFDLDILKKADPELDDLELHAKESEASFENDKTDTKKEKKEIKPEKDIHFKSSQKGKREIQKEKKIDEKNVKKFNMSSNKKLRKPSKKTTKNKRSRSKQNKKKKENRNNQKSLNDRKNTKKYTVNQLCRVPLEDINKLNHFKII